MMFKVFLGHVLKFHLKLFLHIRADYLESLFQFQKCGNTQLISQLLGAALLVEKNFLRLRQIILLLLEEQPRLG